MKKCQYNDCGWCYCPDEKTNNSLQGQCLNPIDCPQIEENKSGAIVEEVAEVERLENMK